MRNKRRIIVSLSHRGRLSLPPHRERLGLEAYHWGLLISPKHSKGADVNSYDVSDAITVDDADTNWRFRKRPIIDPLATGQLLGKIVIGKIAGNVSEERICALLREVPLPRREADPAQSCVTWTLDAVRALQRVDIVRCFDVDRFAVWALEMGDSWMVEPSPGNYVEYKV